MSAKKRPYTVTPKVIKACRKNAPLGGQALVQKYGPEYMAELGRKGYEAFHKKYAWKVVGQSDYALIDRKTKKILKTVSGR